jgi:hypothetical protein
MDQEAFIAQLNALAAGIPPGAFCVEDNKLDHVTYAIVFRGPEPDEYRRGGRKWEIRNGTVVYVGEGKLQRATEQFKRRGKIVGHVGKQFDDFVAKHWPHFEAYVAASNITKFVSLEFERILMKEFEPPFNAAPPRSNRRSLLQDCVDRRSLMRSAGRIGFKFKKDPPAHTHKSLWDERKTMIDGKYFWDEIPTKGSSHASA